MPRDTAPNETVIPFEAEIVFADGEFDRIDLVAYVGRGVQTRTILGWGDLSPTVRSRLMDKFAAQIAEAA